MKTRTSTFNRIVDNAPAMFTAAQLRVFLRALANINPYTFTNGLSWMIGNYHVRFVW